MNLRKLFNKVITIFIKSKNKIKSVESNSISGIGNEIILKTNNQNIAIDKYSGININIKGNNNKIILHEGLVAQNVNINILNDNCSIEICSSPNFFNVNIVCVNGNGQKLHIGENVSFPPFSHVQMTLDDTNEIYIGNDCMFSNTIDLWATDGYSIIDLYSKEVLNEQKHALSIGNHCWIGQYAKITKNASIPDDCIVGISSTVTRTFHNAHCIIAGNPAKVIREGVSWDKRSTYEYKLNIRGDINNG